LQNISANFPPLLPVKWSPWTWSLHKLSLPHMLSKSVVRSLYADMLSQEYSKCPNGQQLRIMLLQIQIKDHRGKQTVKEYTWAMSVILYSIVTIYQFLPNKHTVTWESSH
jgi:hypothetical protein